MKYLIWNLWSFILSQNVLDYKKQLIFSFGIFVLLIIVRKILRNIKIKLKGIAGEKKVKRILSKFEKNGYVVFNDLMLPLYDGTTQIDHVIVGPHGVTAIETKNYAGNIYGSGDNKYWLQILGRARNEFYNPVKQNETHVRTLKYLLQKEGLHYVGVENLVVFTSKKSKIHLNEELPVLKLKMVKKWFENQKNNRIKVDKVALAIEKYKIEDKSKRIEHVKNIKKNHKKRVFN